MTVGELQEMLESLYYDIKSGELCFEDADELARKYTTDCLGDEITKMRSFIKEHDTITSSEESIAIAFIEETRRIQKMVRSSNTWKDFIKALRYHVNHLEQCIHEVNGACESLRIRPQDYLDCAEYWLSVLG